MGNQDLWNLTSIMRRALDRIRKARLKEERDNILLFGSPRSGTTWLMEILSELPGYSSLIEPFNPNWFPEAFHVGIGPREYVKVGSDWYKGRKYLEKVIEGRMINQKPHFKLRPNTVFKRFLSEKLIIKFVRANRLLPWIVDEFQDIKTILVIRHPCAVINSQLKTNIVGYGSFEGVAENGIPTKKELKEEIKGIDSIDDSAIDIIEDITQKEEILAVVWCLDNKIPLVNGPKPNVILTYENLLVKRYEELQKLLSRLDIKFDSLEHFDLDQPSQKTQKEDVDKVKKIDQQLAKWKNNLSKEQIDNILRIVDFFDINLYDEGLTPLEDDMI
ncbi:MAG: sulfotransferase domain-containing protein [Thermoplasmatota archaeon]